MTRIPGKTPLRASLLDRLRSSSGDVSRGLSLRELKESVRRDLEKLLNTRQRCAAPPAELKELAQSLVNYGIPDFTTVRLVSSADWEAFRRALEDSIRRFEPRLGPVRVTIEKADIDERKLRFRIDATLHADPVPEPVVFSSAMEPATGEIKVEEGKR